jgi:protein O-mannosyl-transferase
MSDAPAVWRRKKVILLSGLLLVTAAVYLFNLPSEFSNWDDPYYITENSWIRSWSWQNLYHLTTDQFVANYLPVTMLSFSLDYQLWGLDSRGYHLHNLMLHLICVILVYWLLSSFKVPEKVMWISVSLFALHPTNVESILWATERKNLLASLFFLLSFSLYSKFLVSQSRIQYLLSVLFYLISLLSKVSAVPAAAIFLCYDYFLRGEKFKDLKLYNKIPYLVLAEIATFWTIHAAQISHALNTYHKQGTLTGLLAIPKILGEYCWLLLFPNQINVLYLEHAKYTWSSMSLWFSFIVMLAVLFYFWKSHRHLLFWLSFFLILLLPVLNIVPLPVKMANRYLYISQIGFWIAVSHLGLIFFSTIKPFRIARGGLIVLFCGWSLFLVNQTQKTAKVWRNSQCLWTDSLEKDFYNAMAHTNLGDSIDHKEGQSNLASTHYFIATQLAPRFPVPHNWLGFYFVKNHRLDLAESSFRSAINANPDYDEAMNNLGALYFSKGLLGRSELMFLQAIWINPGNIDAWDNLFYLYLKNNRRQKAREAAEQIIHHFPNLPLGYQRLQEWERTEPHK